MKFNFFNFLKRKPVNPQSNKTKLQQLSIKKTQHLDILNTKNNIETIFQKFDGSISNQLLAAAKAGLFLTQWPPLEGQIINNIYLSQNLQSRPYQIRLARPNDITSLKILESQCWSKELCTPEEILLDRIQKYPQGQLVLEVNCEIAGAIYSQRITKVSTLDNISITEVDSLHDPQAQIVQLLAINIFPHLQQQNFGDRLLEFMLIYHSLQDDIQSLIAVTLCKNFNRVTTEITMQDYIKQRNIYGVLADPILRFHELHGANIERVIPKYRPKDIKNNGAGILVTYNIHCRNRKNLLIPSKHNKKKVIWTEDNLHKYISSIVKDCLGLARANIFDDNRPLMDMGLDSTDLLELKERITHHYALNLTSTFFFEYNNVNKIVQNLTQQLKKEKDITLTIQNHTNDFDQNTDSIKKTKKIAIDLQDIAIIGIACRLPGNINTIEAFWDCLKTGTSKISTLPEGRWSWPSDIDLKNKHKGIDQGGFLKNIAAFDAQFFRISEIEAESMDPQQRILLELSWTAIEHAGYMPSILSNSNTGVFIGASNSDYSRVLVQDITPIGAHYCTGSSMAILANRISYFYNFHGTSLVIDTACSSSLVALHQAVQSMRSGESAQALVGGINLICHPSNNIAYYKAGMLSKDGLCRTFDEMANGYVRSEGAVMMFLKPLTMAQHNNDKIYAVIKGSASNHGGEASGLTVPNSTQQANLLQSAWHNSQINPMHLSYIEAHGTGTPLGDPLEIQGIKQAFSTFSKKNQYAACGLGSVKTNLGHLEAAAGIVGLLKVVLCLQQRKLPVNVHFKRLNTHINLSETNLYIVNQLKEWQCAPGAQTRIAGVSSFGSGGTNAHIVIEEYNTTNIKSLYQSTYSNNSQVFVLSAKTDTQLQQYIKNCISWLNDPCHALISLENIILQFQIGRQPMKKRLAIVVSNRKELINKLMALTIQTKPEKHYISSKNKLHSSVEKINKTVILSLVNEQKWEKLAQLWQSGIDFDWSILYSTKKNFFTKSQRFSIPTYPFSHKDYWISHHNSTSKILQTDSKTTSHNVFPICKAKLFVPYWQLLNKQDFFNKNYSSLKNNQHILITGVNLAEQQHITKLYPMAQLLEINSQITIKSIIAILNADKIFNHIIWIAPDKVKSITSIEEYSKQQHTGILFLFKLIKGLLNSGYNERTLNWTILTYCTQAVFNTDRITAVHAGVHGLIGVMAKEYPQWKVHSFDLDFTKIPSFNLFDLSHIHSLPSGEIIAYRGGQWFHRVLNLITIPEITHDVYKQNGVYVIIGGAGGIGKIWSYYIVKRYSAQIIWIGRRAQDKHISDAQDTIAAFGPRPLYLSANAADVISLKIAYTKIKQQYGNIHGVIQSATGIFDYSLAEMQEERFCEILSAKIDISVNLIKFFANESLDFILYFSSIISLEKNGGYSGYATGGAFADALALQIAQQVSYVVRVINWGHWAIGTGQTISNAAKVRFLNSGGIPIEENEAMTSLQKLLNAPIHQAALLKTSRPDLFPLIDTEHTLEIVSTSIPSVIKDIKQITQTFNQDISTLKLTSVFNHSKIEAALLPLFAGILTTINKDIPPKINYYQNWLDSSRRILNKHGFNLSIQTTHSMLEELWKRWKITKEHHFNTPDIQPAVTLVEICLHALPQIITGSVKAIDLLFPNASMQLVEDIYRNNATANYFNKILAQSTISAIKARLKNNSHAKLHILELGAGSGATTAMILPLLEPYRNHILEYTYTDISKAFLFYAEKNFVQKYTYVVPRLFDIEKPLTTQDLPIKNYDLVIATNVLHATRNIRHTLANVKATLHHNGLLLLNEISVKSLFAHLTFGLLEGWWLSEDQILRIQDSPGLYPDNWKNVLMQEGFTQVVFPVPKTHILGQQIIIAESNGIIRQETPIKIKLPIKKVLPNTSLQLEKSDKTRWHQNLKEATNNSLRKIVAHTLHMDNAQIDVHEPLETYGIDSILIMQLTNALQEVFTDIKINNTLMFECQTVEELSEYFIKNAMLSTLLSLTGMQTESVALSYTNEKSVSHIQEKNTIQKNTKTYTNTLPEVINEPIAIIGMSCHFPQANNINEYWELLSIGKTCIREVPPERWKLENFFHSDVDEALKLGKSYSKWGAFLDNITNFDPLFFNISPKEAIAIDPQERLFLQTAWETLEDASYTRQRILTEFQQQLGVFVGITRTGFDLFGPELWRHGHIIYPHTSFSSIANRVSYFLNARGPSIPVDTMCSSSLTAIHLACQSLHNKECQIALVGGVNIYLHPSAYVGLSASRMLSKDGICRSFGKNSNGFVPGEGVGAVLLKPLSRAIADNDQIHAVIRATNINHNGKTNGYTVPNPLAQAELIMNTLNKARINAREISYIEAHGTGTELGDPIEITGLTKAFRHYTTDNNYCSLGSVKSNIGHLEAAAGIAGLIKVILQIRHKKLVPSLHATELNPSIDFHKTPFFIQQTLTNWSPLLSIKTGKPLSRIAGISSFGAGGVNAHIILEEYPQENHTQQSDINEDFIILLSARNKESLQTAIKRLSNFITQCATQNDLLVLENLAYTLQIGREHMDIRLGLIVRTIAQLQNYLKTIITGDNLEKINLYMGDIKQYKDILSEFSHDETMQQTITSWFSKKQYKHLLNLWSKGLDVNWKNLHSKFFVNTRQSKCITLPTYAFSETSYWLPITKAEIETSSAKNTITKPITPVLTSTTTVIQKHISTKPTTIALQKPLINLDISRQTTTEAETKCTITSHYNPLRNTNNSDSRDDNNTILIKTNPVNNNTITIVNNSTITLYKENNHIFSIKFENSEYCNEISIDNICTAISDCFFELRKFLHKNKLYVVLLRDLHKMFPATDVQQSFEITKTITTIISCTIPVIAILSNNNYGYYSMLAAAACDLIIYSTEGIYSIFSENLSHQARKFFVARLGEKATQIIGTTTIKGSDLLNFGWLAPVMHSTKIEEYTNYTIEAISKISPIILTELKQHLNRQLIPLITNFEDSLKPLITNNNQIQTLQQLYSSIFNKHLDLFTNQQNSISTNADFLPVTININSDVVSLKKYKNGVVVISLHDRINKNTFSPDFVTGLISAFNHIANTNDYKVVVLTGYDNYFACGGTKKNLLAIQKGNAKFTDEQSYSMPLLCDIPVIAAMQGHAIGAGWTMGLFCDFTIYSEESIYQSPYMRYGFTPGAGATLIFPERLGHDACRNIFMTAREFQGHEFNTHAIGMLVLPRHQVLTCAIEIANQLALSDRKNLIQDKQRCVASLRQQLQSTFNKELLLHDKTFVGNPAVITGIENYYKTQTKNLLDKKLDIINHDIQIKQTHYTLSQKQIFEILEKSLIEELQLYREQFNPDIAFIDMGMDSITAVTWIHKINKQLNLSLETTAIYNYPTFTKFFLYVLDNLPETIKTNLQNSVKTTIIQNNNLNSINKETILLWLRNTLAIELLIQAENLNDNTKFVDIGLDSITAVTWIRAINNHYNLSINATYVYNYPTLAQFSEYIWENIQKSFQCLKFANDKKNVIKQKTIASIEKKIIKQFTLSKKIHTHISEKPLLIEESTIDVNLLKKRNIEAIAIIGMAGEFPKASGIKEFWENIMQGRNCVGEIPATRWNINNFYSPDRKTPGKTICRNMGALNNIDIFDPLFFNISPSEAEYMDPQQRLFLQNSWRCIEDAGYNPTDLSGNLVGVFVGCAVSDYSHNIKSKNEIDDVYILMGESIALLPARIAYFLNLQGPCLAIDTACSSSLVALANACDSLILGHSNLALAGGVYIINGPDIHIKMSKAGMLSPDGHCFSFDQRANGFVPGEGVGVLMLKRLKDAEQDNDDIYGIIRGWGVNQDGKTNGITAPNKDSQIRLETNVYKKFNINPEYIELIEAHGTGTKLGDPIEVDALCASFRQFTTKNNYCALGSVKSNIGHLATAAGIAGIIKATMALKHKKLPPTIYYKTLNEHINLDNSPFYINIYPTPWKIKTTNTKRLAAVSSFGFSGTNGHIVLEESILRENNNSTKCYNNKEILLPLSAKSFEQLIQYAQLLYNFLATSTDVNSLVDLAYTFQIGRNVMRYRLAIIANTIETLQEYLKKYIDTKIVNEHCFYGDASTYTEKHIIQENSNQEINLFKLAQQWVNGEHINWYKIYSSDIYKPKRTHGLPTYPFSHEHYWIPVSNNKKKKKIKKNFQNIENNQKIVSKNTDNLSKWFSENLPTNISWEIELKILFSKKILVLYANDIQYRAFVDLLSQFKQASYLEEDLHIEYHNIEEIQFKSNSNNAIPNTVLLLAGTISKQETRIITWIRALKTIAKIKKNNFLEIIVLIQANMITSDHINHIINKIINNKIGHILLISQENISLNNTIQILYKEWLAFSQSQKSLCQVHYTNNNIRKVKMNEQKLLPCDLTSIYLIRKEWIAKDTIPLIEFVIRGTVLILVNEDSFKIARKLLNIEDFKRIIFIGDNNETITNTLHITINFSDIESTSINTRSLINQYNDITHIIDLSDLYEKNSQYDTSNIGKIIFYQHLIGTYNNISIIYFTKNLQDFNSSEHTLKGAKFIGLMKMLSADYAHVNSRCIDIDNNIYTHPNQLRKIILKEFQANLQETELCYRNNCRFVPTLSPVNLPLYLNETKPKFLSDSVYIISGGTNGIGLEIANYLVSCGVRHLILMGITDLPCKNNWTQAINENNLSDYIKNKLIKLIKLNKLVDTLKIYTGDLSNLTELEEYFNNIRTKYGKIKGIVHSAGVYSDINKPGFVNKNITSIKAVLSAKVTGLENLHIIFKNDILDFFISFSSVTGVIPNLARGMSDYAMANTFVDFFSSYHNKHNNCICYKNIIWSDWNETGAMTRISTKQREIIKDNFCKLGIRTFLNNEGYILFERAITLKEGGTIFIGYVDYEQFKNTSSHLLYANFENIQKKQIKEHSSLLYKHLEKWEAIKNSGLKVSIQAITDVVNIDQIQNLEPSLITRIHKLLFNENYTGQEIQNQMHVYDNNNNQKNHINKNYINIESIVTKIVIEVLKLKKINIDESFQNYGLDSISAVVLATRLEKHFKTQVLPQWLIDFPTIKTLSEHFVKQNI